MPSFRIGLIGDHDATVPAHRAIPRALEIAAAPFLDGGKMEINWLPTEALAGLDEGLLTKKLSSFGGLWCVPASPYASEAGALAAIRYARENAVPFLGTCGGFQHALLEYARNVCGLMDAAHAETHPGVTAPLITTLTCSLVETEGRILLAAGSRIRAIYGKAEITEPYHCRYGLNAAFVSRLDDGHLRFSGRDAAGEVRVLELDSGPFFVATLFQPERAALRGEGHPLIHAYVEAVLRRARAGQAFFVVADAAAELARNGVSDRRMDA